ncbi:DUF4169 family protein [Phenylobacterium immobile]|uniref:DUF4169 family protein n=1 Tax=Phenylobacterium immobile TaxID=21 RepID=UPI000A82CE2D|nr:DUF4169 family protein [Phenylobacterium immobile]
MAEPINLNRARKARDKAQAKSRAVENRARFGLGKADRSRAQAETERAARDLEGKKRE